MEKVNKSTEIKKMLAESKTPKQIAEELKTNIAYVYKMQKEIKKNIKD